MTKLDWIALAFIALNALMGLRRGLIGTVLALAGLVVGAIVGDRVGPHLLDHGAHSAYTPLAAFVGALAGAAIGRMVAALIASFARNGLRLVPPLRTLDSIGGLAAGAAIGIVIVWVLGAVALEIPGEPTLRTDVQRSAILQRLNEVADPGDLLRELNRIDELPSLEGPLPALPAPNKQVLAEAAVRLATSSVVRVTAEACGLGVEGSGWVAAPHLVVTAAHVVKGASGILVDGKPAKLFAIDRLNDVAVLDVPSLSARPLRLGGPREGSAVAILGYPEDGPFNAQPGRIGATSRVDFNGSERVVTDFSGAVEPGNSGGPVLDAAGVVETTVFAKRVGAAVGYGVPTAAVSAALARAHGPISSGSC